MKESDKYPCFIPFIAHEGEMTRLERINQRLVAVIILLAIIILLISIVGLSGRV